MSVLVAALDMLLALVLASAAMHKIVAADRLSAATARLLGVSLEAGRVMRLLAATWEGAAAVAILWEPARPVGLGMATLLWLFYARLTAIAKRRGDAFDCGCSFASEKRGADPLTAPRALLLSLLAAAAIPAPVTPAFAPAAIFAGLGFFALMVAATEIASIVPLARRRTA